GGRKGLGLCRAGRPGNRGREDQQPESKLLHNKISIIQYDTKSEIRNPKFETNSNSEEEVPNEEPLALVIGILDFGFVSDFEIRFRICGWSFTTRRKPMSFANQVAIITGASSGIGWELAKTLARQGFAVGVLARRQERLAALVA